jgi:hypothetical protein
VVSVTFMERARNAAAAEFGRRHYRWFLAFAMLRRVLPVAAVFVVVLGLLAVGAVAVDSWESWRHWIPAIITWTAVVAGISLPAAFAVWVWRNRWRWW